MTTFSFLSVSYMISSSHLYWSQSASIFSLSHDHPIFKCLVAKGTASSVHPPHISISPYKRKDNTTLV